MNKINIMFDSPIPTIKPTKWAKDAAMAIAKGKRFKTFEYTSSGAYTRAYMNEFLAVKGGKSREWYEEGSAVRNYLDWLITVENAMRCKFFRETAAMYIAPCTILHKSVIVQERMMLLGEDVPAELSDAVECLAIELGISDMHDRNWGFNIFGEIKIFDMMPFCMGNFRYNKNGLRVARKNVEDLLDNLTK